VTVDVEIFTRLIQSIIWVIEHCIYSVQSWIFCKNSYQTHTEHYLGDRTLYLLSSELNFLQKLLSNSYRALSGWSNTVFTQFRIEFSVKTLIRLIQSIIWVIEHCIYSVEFSVKTLIRLIQNIIWVIEHCIYSVQCWISCENSYQTHTEHYLGDRTLYLLTLQWQLM
jgi:hypothetical protein